MSAHCNSCSNRFSASVCNQCFHNPAFADSYQPIVTDPVVKTVPIDSTRTAWECLCRRPWSTIRFLTGRLKHCFRAPMDSWDIRCWSGAEELGPVTFQYDWRRSIRAILDPNELTVTVVAATQSDVDDILSLLHA